MGTYTAQILVGAGHPNQDGIIPSYCLYLSENSFKLVVTMMRGSLLTDQLKILEHYQMDVEVCTPTYVRLYSRWLEQTRVEGNPQGLYSSPKG